MLSFFLPSQVCRRIGGVCFLSASAKSIKSAKVFIIGAAPSSLSIKQRLNALGLPVFEAYGTSEAGMIACNLPQHNRVGSAGKAWRGVATRISSDGTLQVRCEPPRTFGYVNVDEMISAATFLQDEWIDTGDLVRIDNDGYIFVEGRRKELLVTDRGTKVNIGLLETGLESLAPIERALIAGEGRPYIVAVLNLRPGFDVEDARKAIHGFNRDLADHEQIRDVLVEEHFSSDPRYSTSLGKLKRRAILDRFASEIDKMYPSLPNG